MLTRSLWSRRGLAAQDPNLKGVLRDFRGNAGLSMQWVLFGSSGHEKRPTPGGPLAHFYKCTGELSFQMKCMANMYHAARHVLVGNTVHDCTYKCALASQIGQPFSVSRNRRLWCHLLRALAADRCGYCPKLHTAARRVCYHA